uniref:Uncharacterized protein n=1 Tax=viral metagenome TaxID=1070528 RepID=A0A6C0HX41_9ZZZZ
MPLITNKNGKIMPNKPAPAPVAPSPPLQSNWVQHTKDFSQKNNVTFGAALSNTNNRCQYYDTMIDRTKYNRGPNMVQADHPAMHSFIPNLTPQDKKIKDEILVQTKRHMAGKKVNLK